MKTVIARDDWLICDLDRAASPVPRGYIPK